MASVKLPWRYEASPEWLAARNDMCRKLKLKGPSIQPRAFEQLQQLYGEYDQIEQCGTTLVKLRNGLRTVACAIELAQQNSHFTPLQLEALEWAQKWKRAEYTRARVLLQQLLTRIDKTLAEMIAVVQDCHASVPNTSIGSPDYIKAHQVVAYFCTVTDDGQLDRLLAHHRQLADDDATGGEGAKALLFFSMLVKPAYAGCTVFGQSSSYSEVPADLQIPKQFNANDQIGKTYSLIEPSLHLVSEARELLADLQLIKDVDAIVGQSYRRVRHLEQPLADAAQKMDDKIAQWLRSRPHVFERADKDYQLRWASALLAADYARAVLHETLKWARELLPRHDNAAQASSEASRFITHRFRRTLHALTGELIDLPQ